MFGMNRKKCGGLDTDNCEVESAIDRAKGAARQAQQVIRSSVRAGRDIALKVKGSGFVPQDFDAPTC